MKEFEESVDDKYIHVFESDRKMHNTEHKKKQTEKIYNAEKYTTHINTKTKNCINC